MGETSSIEQGTDSNTLNDYINASYINTVLQNKLIIAASAPIKKTIPDFLQMIMENKVTLIMMMCDFKVSDKEQCAPYLGKEQKNFHALDKLMKRTNGQKLFQSSTFPSRNEKKLYKVQGVNVKTKFGGQLVIRKMKVSVKFIGGINTKDRNDQSVTK